uniref:SH3 domain-binding protein 5-like (inferred by orthology to a human protein) n=1 Tax=Strongyloides venezuelensis TaxID=75913 RepID=A0A0K0FWG7_STRVS
MNYTHSCSNSKPTSKSLQNDNKVKEETLSIISEEDKSFKPSHKRNESSDTGIHYVDDDDGVEFQLDQRYLNKVHEELEKLNIATDVINKLEVQLDEARRQFRMTQQKWSQKLDELSKKYGSVISKSRPYYEAKLQERTLREEAQNAAIRFERANTLLAVAKEQVKFTQESLSRQKVAEPACLEVLNHHIQRIGEAEKERTNAENCHKEISIKMTEISQKIKQMERDHNRAIKKSRYYFEQRMEFTKILEGQKHLINKLEKEVKQKKSDYTSSLKNLERISESIHEERSLSSIKRSSRAPSPISSSPSTNRHDFDTGKNYDFNGIGNDCMSEVYASESSGIPPDPSDIGIIEDDLDSIDGGSSFNGDNGVILLAQQLIGEEEKEKSSNHIAYKFRPEQTDIRYTTMPEGIRPLPSSSGYGSDASLSSFDDTVELSKMLRSHSQLIHDIDDGADRLKNILHQRSVSDVQNESIC